MKFDMLIKNGKVVIPKLGIKKTNIAISMGKIAALLKPGLSVTANNVLDAKGKYVLPGLIEPHSHFGLGDGDKDYYTETKSAAVGGVTTVLNYLNDSGVYDERTFKRVVENGEKQAFVDFSIHFCITSREQLNKLDKYIYQYGISSFKFFMNFRGEEGRHLGIRAIDDGFLFACFSALGKYQGSLACVHAENIEIGWVLREKLIKLGRTDLRAWEEHKPDYVEAEAVRRAIYLAEVANCPIYIVHVSSKKGLAEIREYRNSRYKRIYAETATHYLSMTSDSDLGVIGKVSPPLRYREDMEGLWQGIADGTIDTIGTDHVPRKKVTKTGTVWEASAGFPGIGTLLPFLLSEGVNKRGIKIERIAELTSYNVGKIFHLHPRKGTIEIGSDADLTVVDLDLEKEVKWKDLYSHSDYTLYEGWRLKGWPVLTIVRGKVIAEHGKIKGKPGYGRFVPRFEQHI
ncbi:MAG: dihydroorotase family protein [Candidatus Hodarchaeota archaeon]